MSSIERFRPKALAAVFDEPIAPIAGALMAGNKLLPPIGKHPLGFCVVLLQNDYREEWRFHVWPKGVRQMTGMPGLIHTHNKVVESKILRGEGAVREVVEIELGDVVSG